MLKYNITQQGKPSYIGTKTTTIYCNTVLCIAIYRDTKSLQYPNISFTITTFLFPEVPSGSSNDPGHVEELCNSQEAQKSNKCNVKIPDQLPVNSHGYLKYHQDVYIIISSCTFTICYVNRTEQTVPIQQVCKTLSYMCSVFSTDIFYQSGSWAVNSHCTHICTHMYIVHTY